MEDALYIRDSDGDLKVFNVECNDSRLWLNSNYGNPDNFWNADNQWAFVRPRNSLCLPCPAYCGTGFYLTDFSHPPSILPISSNFSESIIYFLLSSDFISQATCRKNFNKSNLKEARFRDINFSALFEYSPPIINSVVSKNKQSIFSPRVYLESFGKCGRRPCHSL